VSEMPIRVRSVLKRYPQFILKDIDLDVPAGRVLGLIGLSFFFDKSGLRFLLLRDAPVVGSLSLAIGLALWIAYGITARWLRVTGL